MKYLNKKTRQGRHCRVAKKNKTFIAFSSIILRVSICMWAGVIIAALLNILSIYCIPYNTPPTFSPFCPISGQCHYESIICQAAFYFERGEFWRTSSLWLHVTQRRHPWWRQSFPAPAHTLAPLTAGHHRLQSTVCRLQWRFSISPFPSHNMIKQSVPRVAQKAATF